MDTQIIPIIKPVSNEIHRPIWSVMIPTYNCAQYLRETLASVLCQDPGEAVMQIEVIDDCSIDNPEAVVNEVGQGRVVFYQQFKNVGAIQNFNTCIQRSRGYLIHILHGDDLVEGDFYSKMYELSQKYPSVALLASRAFEIDENNELLNLSSRLDTLEKYSQDPFPFYYSNHFRTPAIVINRKFYESHGGFREDLVHTADWEMWIRAISKQGGAALNLPLAKYRIFSQNHTGKLMKTGDNLRDCLKLAELLKKEFVDFKFRKFQQLIADGALAQSQLFLKLNNRDAADNNYKLWWQISSFSSKRYWITQNFKKYLKEKAIKILRFFTQILQKQKITFEKMVG